MKTMSKNFALIFEAVAWLKALPMTFEYTQEDDGSFSGSVKEFKGIENAPTLEELKIVLIKSMKEWADVLADDFQDWSKGRFNEIPYLFKILISTEEELSSCLNGEISSDF